MNHPTHAYVQPLPGMPIRAIVTRILSILPTTERPASCKCNSEVGHHAEVARGDDHDCAIALHERRVATIGRIVRETPHGHELVDLNGFRPDLGALVFLNGVKVTSVAR